MSPIKYVAQLMYKLGVAFTCCRFRRSRCFPSEKQTTTTPMGCRWIHYCCHHSHCFHSHFRRLPNPHRLLWQWLYQQLRKFPLKYIILDKNNYRYSGPQHEPFQVWNGCLLIIMGVCRIVSRKGQAQNLQDYVYVLIITLNSQHI